MLWLIISRNVTHTLGLYWAQCLYLGPFYTSSTGYWTSGHSPCTQSADQLEESWEAQVRNLESLEVTFTDSFFLVSKTSDDPVLCPCRILQEVYSSHNQLTELQSLVESFPALQILDVSDNCIEVWQQVVSSGCLLKVTHTAMHSPETLWFVYCNVALTKEVKPPCPHHRNSVLI